MKMPMMPAVMPPIVSAMITAIGWMWTVRPMISG